MLSFFLDCYFVQGQIKSASFETMSIRHHDEEVPFVRGRSVKDEVVAMPGTL